MMASADLADRYRARIARSAAAKAHQGAAGTEVPLEQDQGISILRATLNGTATYSFMIDSGSSDVVIPKSIATELVLNGSLTPEDFIQDGVSVLADRSELAASRFILHSISVGGVTATNVECSIGGEGSSPLLGQSFLRKFSSWSIDNTRGVLVLGL